MYFTACCKHPTHVEDCNTLHCRSHRSTFILYWIQSKRLQGSQFEQHHFESFYLSGRTNVIYVRRSVCTAQKKKKRLSTTHVRIESWKEKLEGEKLFITITWPTEANPCFKKNRFVYLSKKSYWTLLYKQLKQEIKYQTIKWYKLVKPHSTMLWIFPFWLLRTCWKKQMCSFERYHFYSNNIHRDLCGYKKKTCNLWCLELVSSVSSV